MNLFQPCQQQSRTNLQAELSSHPGSGKARQASALSLLRYCKHDTQDYESVALHEMMQVQHTNRRASKPARSWHSLVNAFAAHMEKLESSACQHVDSVVSGDASKRSFTGGSNNNSNTTPAQHATACEKDS
jgi:hypothetical protein